MQIISGTVTIVSVGSTLVTGSSSADWSQVTVNNWFVILGQIYQITDVVFDTVWKLTISPGFIGDGVNGVTNHAYVIVRDFTPSYHLPLLNPGDLEASPLWSRALMTIDGFLGTEGGTEDIPVLQNAHGFAIGNALKWVSGTGYARASATNDADSTIVGVVSTVTDANNFTYRMVGTISGIAGTLTIGAIYFLSASANSPNITSSAPALRVPVLQAVTASSGILLTFAISRMGVFSTGINGLVPGPIDSPGTTFLRDDAVWSSVTPAADSITTTHCLKPPADPTDWTGFHALAGDLSLVTHINYLHTHLENIEVLHGSVAYTRYVLNRRSTPGAPIETAGGLGEPRVHTFTVPAEVSRVFVTLFSGSEVAFDPQASIGNFSPALRSWVVRCELSVVPYDEVELTIAPLFGMQLPDRQLGIKCSHNGSIFADLYYSSAFAPIIDTTVVTLIRYSMARAIPQPAGLLLTSAEYGSVFRLADPPVPGGFIWRQTLVATDWCSYRQLPPNLPYTSLTRYITVTGVGVIEFGASVNFGSGAL